VVATVLRLRMVLFPELAQSTSALSDEVLHWIGFSYFLLKSIHVMLATSRGIVAVPTLVGLVQYVLFFPTLTAGPIYRFDVFSQQLDAPKAAAWSDLHDGLLRILVGMAKKVVVVPFLKTLSINLHARGVAFEPAAYVVTYAMLFLDFSGYSDIAIGIGRLLGFEVPENFKHVFTATTLTQFWRNWHATLGDWVRENVFIPMGGVRATGWQLSAIVVFSMLIVGLWHGYQWIFIGWGVFHGVMLLIENRLGVKPLRAHRTPWWQLWLRYALVQAVVIAGMFAFIGGLSP
jgi:alginate O-acetyltransferase complex protein AlgI